MKRLIYGIIALIALGLIVFATIFFYPLLTHIFCRQIQSASDVAVAAPPPASSNYVQAKITYKKIDLDIDAMAARMKRHKDIYEKIRDEAFSEYSKLHPDENQLNDTLKTIIRIWAYKWIWGDYYEEGLSNKSRSQLSTAHYNIHDKLLDSFYYISENESNSYAYQENTALEFNKAAFEFGKTSFPLEFKYWRYVTTINNLMHHRKHLSPTGQSLAQVPDLLKEAIECYQQMVKKHIPDNLLFNEGRSLLKALDNNGELLKSGWEGLDKVFANNDPENPIRTILKGDFYITYAWQARGNGWANSVAQDGWKLMAERLNQAEEILEGAYKKWPDKPQISYLMINVELGQGKGRERMETWFQRAIKADPDYYSAYAAKAWYLQPRWHGTFDEAFSFAEECVQTNKWSEKIPLVLIETVKNAAMGNPAFYEHPQIWKSMEKVFRTYLNYYPESTYYRSEFAISAALGNHWDIAREQLAYLTKETFDGDMCFRLQTPWESFDEFKKAVDQHASKEGGK